MEEAVFRGFLQPSLGKHVPPAAAIGLSSLAFALIHATPNELPQVKDCCSLKLVLRVCLTK